MQDTFISNLERPGSPRAVLAPGQSPAAAKVEKDCHAIVLACSRSKFLPSLASTPSSLLPSSTSTFTAHKGEPRGLRGQTRRRGRRRVRQTKSATRGLSSSLILLARTSFVPLNAPSVDPNDPTTPPASSHHTPRPTNQRQRISREVKGREEGRDLAHLPASSSKVQVACHPAPTSPVPLPSERRSLHPLNPGPLAQSAYRAGTWGTARQGREGRLPVSIVEVHGEPKVLRRSLAFAIAGGDGPSASSARPRETARSSCEVWRGGADGGTRRKAGQGGWDGSSQRGREDRHGTTSELSVCLVGPAGDPAWMGDGCYLLRLPRFFRSAWDMGRVPPGGARVTHPSQLRIDRLVNLFFYAWRPRSPLGMASRRPPRLVVDSCPSKAR